jgi:hypothetical protein
MISEDDNPALENDGSKKVRWTLPDLDVDADAAPIELPTFISDV